MRTKISLAMDRAGLKGVDMRRALDVGEAMVSMWRTGKMYVSPKYQKALSDILGMSPEELFDELGRPRLVTEE